MSRATARRDSRRNPADRVGTRRPVLVFVGLLIAIVLTSYGIRIATDAPFLLSGTEPEPEDFESRYVAHPWLAYVHMTPGVLYLLGSFGAAFWIALSLHVLAGEWWIRTTPPKDG
jgi:hypothetical protein